MVNIFDTHFVENLIFNFYYFSIDKFHQAEIQNYFTRHFNCPALLSICILQL